MRHVKRLGAACVLAACLAGCSTLEGVDATPGALVSGGRDVAAEQESVRRFANVQTCPQVQVRDGTQAMRIYQRGKDGDPSALNFQGTISRFARECAVAADGGTVIKVGVAGRVVNGPTGATGDVALPLRVVLVKNGDEVLYSQIHTVSATIAPGLGSVAWTQVVDGLTIPYQFEQGNFVIYVGFDEGA